MILRVTCDRHSTAVRSYHIAFRNRVFGVVSPFSVNVRLEREQQFRDCRLGENGDEVDRSEGRNDLGALILRNQRSAFTLKAASLRVGVNRYYQQIAQSLCRL